MALHSDIDNIDLSILSILMQDASMPYTEIARQLNVSGGTIHVRMKKMEQLGIVKQTQLVVDYSKIGYDIVAFLGIYLKESSFYDATVAELSKIPEILSINYTTGNYSIFAKLICKDTKHLMQVLHDKIQKINGIESTETSISLQEEFNRPLKLA